MEKVIQYRYSLDYADLPLGIDVFINKELPSGVVLDEFALSGGRWVIVFTITAEDLAGVDERMVDLFDGYNKGIGHLEEVTLAHYATLYPGEELD